jgi:hypothetical protein
LNRIKVKRGRLKRVLHFGQYVGENSKYASEYPENVVVKELPRFNAVGKRLTNAGKLAFMF